MTKELELNENSDYSVFLITLQSMIRSGQAIPQKYFLPSYILKSIVQEYYEAKYQTVVDLSYRILENRDRYDQQIIRETRYWLCLGFCRLTNEQFFEELSIAMSEDLFTQKDYYFLIGFYFRLAKRPKKAEENFLKALEIDEKHSRSKRELVTVYLQQEQFSKALNYAQDNFNEAKSNLLHINAYFTALINKPTFDEDDIDILEDLMDRTQRSKDSRATEFFDIMRADYSFYITKNIDYAIEQLHDIFSINKKNYHAYKSLRRILSIIGDTDELRKLDKVFENEHLDVDNL